MDIYEYAMQMERDGEAFYRDLARQSPNRGIKRILTMLADEEQRHYNAIARMKSTEPVQLAESSVLADAKNVFVQLKKSGEEFASETNQIKLYRKALEIEAKSRDFYNEKAGEASDTDVKKLFLRLVGEEQKHYVLVENIIDFLSGPETWLENAEFCHLEEY
ncbi:MAG: ferritin family protein [Planctomycetota bacterium]